MKRILARIGLAALMAVGTFGVVVPAHADGFSFGIEIGEGHRHRPRPWDGDGEWGGGGWDGGDWGGGGYGRRGCRPEVAARIARYEGLRHVRIVDISPRRVVVAGRDRYGWTRLVFANVRGCPLISR